VYGLIALLCVALSEVTPPAEAAAKAKPKPPPNLVVNGDFEQGDGAPLGWDKPDGERVRWAAGCGADATRGVCIEMDKEIAFGYGQGYFSNPIPVETDTAYRLSVDVKSDAPNAILFIKGFAKVKGPAPAKGPEWREVYSHHKEAHFDRYLEEYVRSGKFVTQSFTFHPRHSTFEVEHVKIWLYGYLKPGTLCFDNVRLEKVGKAEAAAEPKPARKARPRPRPPDPDGESSPPVYLDPN